MGSELNSGEVHALLLADALDFFEDSSNCHLQDK